jgi:hypothetical protein
MMGKINKSFERSVIHHPAKQMENSGHRFRMAVIHPSHWSQKMKVKMKVSITKTMEKKLITKKISITFASWDGVHYTQISTE